MGINGTVWVISQLGDIILCQILSIGDLISAMRKEVDYLLMAKPDAINQLEIRRDCVHLLGVSGCW